VLLAAQAGAAWAFTRLWEDVGPAVFGYLRTRGAADPEDLASEVLLGVFARIGTFRGDERAFRSWVFTIAHHRLVDDRRAQARRRTPREYTQDDYTRRAPSAEDDALLAESTTRVRTALAGLSPDQCDVLTLRILADLTVEQVASVLGKPVGAVKSLQHRGLATLRRNLSEAVPL
jgi:RNA polymerase sigma-70 factor (ECF subfamily)